MPTIVENLYNLSRIQKYNSTRGIDFRCVYFPSIIFLILQNLCKCRITVHKVQSGGGEIFRSEKIMVLIWLLLWLTTQQFTVLQPATTHLLPNKSFVSMIKMSNPVLLTMQQPILHVQIQFLSVGWVPWYWSPILV